MNTRSSLPGMHPLVIAASLFLIHLFTPLHAALGQSVEISEFVASNSGSLLDEDGDSSDWIELHNASEADVDLEGWALSDDGGDPSKWLLPSVVLPADSYLVIFASGKDRRTLGNAWDTVVRAQDTWRYRTGTAASGWQNVDYVDLAWSTGAAPIGFGEAGLNTTIPNGTQALFLRRKFTIDDPSNVLRGIFHISYDDGYVAYVNGTQISTANCCSSPTPVEPEALSPITLNSIASLLQPGENVLAIEIRNSGTNSSDLLANPYLTLEFSTPPTNPRGIADEVRPIPEQNLHANFSLAQEGEYLALTNPDGEAVSEFNPYPPQHPGVSYGTTGGRFGFFSIPTPGGANGSLVSGLLSPPSFSMAHGFFDAPFRLLIFPETPGSIIHYTNDGSEPSETNGQIYTGPITIDRTSIIRAMATAPGAIPSESVTQTYIFLDDVIRQSANGSPPPGWPARWGSNATDYGMDPQVVNGNEEEVIESLLSIPSVSLVTDRDHLFDEETGIYSNALGYGREWERPTSLELIHPDGTGGFQINAGVRIRGGYSRNDPNPKHAFRFYFRKEYGPGKLVYPLFGDEGVGEFDVIDLRTSQNYSWAYNGDSRNTMVREVWARDTQKVMGVPYTRSRYYHLYVNGQYWGVFQTQERAEASYAESYFGGNKDEYDVIKSAGLDGGYEIEATDGDFTAWRALWEGVNQIPLLTSEQARTEQYMRLQGLNPDGSRNPAYEVLLDVDNLINYMLVIFYTGNFDAPISGFLGNDRTNNFFSIRRRGGDQGFVHFAHDNEHTLLPEDNRYTNRTGPFPAGSRFEYANPQWFHQQLMASGEYRLRFADIAYEHLFNDGVLTTPEVLDRFDERAAQVESAMLAESARWGDSKVSQPLGPTHWRNEINRLRTSILPSRTLQIVSQLRSTTRYIEGNPLRGTTSAPLYPAVVAPTLSSNGGEVAANFGLQITAPAGQIFFTLDGSDPRLIGGATAPTAIEYSGTITLSQPTTVKARVRSSEGWSALAQAEFRPGSVGPQANRLTISEINYHPADVTDEEIAAGFSESEDFEFVEIANITNAPVDLNGIRFADGIEYTFGDVLLGVGERIVLASSPDALAARYGTVKDVVGPYQGRLSNSGETLTLVAPDGSVLASLDFGDTRPWPVRADGVGSTLELVDLNADVSEPSSWRASIDYLGSPGGAGSTTLPGIVFNEILPNAQDPLSDAIELFNTTEAEVDLSGWYVSDGRDLKKLRLPDGTVIPAGGYLVLEEEDFNPSDDDTGFTLNGTRPETLWLVEADDSGRITRFSDEVLVPAARPDESYGRWPNASGSLFVMQETSLGAANSSPAIGPVVIREIMYEPPGNNENLEYIELHNAGAGSEDLSRWAVTDAVEFTFADGTVIAPGGSVSIVSFNPAVEREKARTFRAAYWHLGGSTLVGPWSGRLDNTGEPIILYRALAPTDDDPTNRPLVLEDRVTYAGVAPWPTDAAGQGAALRKMDPLAFSDDPDSWTAAVRPVDVEEQPPIPLEAFLLKPPYPNPASETATVLLQLRDAQRVRVEVYDVLGRRVMNVYDGLLDGGREHRFELSTSALSSGLYVVRAIGEGAEGVVTVTIVR